MSGKYYSRMAAITALLFIFHPPSARCQNNYPSSGDALIHGLTIGTGNGARLSNTALGDSTLFFNKAGINNTAVGRSALLHNSSGPDNTALGSQALYSNVSGGYNLAMGFGAMLNNYSGSYNVALGIVSLNTSTNASYNTAIGGGTLRLTTSGLGNTTCGTSAGAFITTGSYNTGVGDQSMVGDSTGSYCTAVGAAAVPGYNPTNAIGIGAVSAPMNSNSVLFSSATSIGGFAAWTNFSDGRYKKNVSRNVPGLPFILRLEPVTYTLDVDGMSKTDIHTGFIAQDVERTAQSINYMFSGVDKPGDNRQSFYGLRYSDFVVPLVKAVQELSAENDSLKTAHARLLSQLDQVEQSLGIGNHQSQH